MKVIVVDTNIIFSALVSKNSTIGEIIIGSKEIQFFASDYMRIELKKHHQKLKKCSNMTDDEMDNAQYELFKYIHFITLDTVPERYWLEAERLVSDIDVDDTPFVALSLYLDAYLWTGDKALYAGLKAKGFQQVISTKELQWFGKE